MLSGKIVIRRSSGEEGEKPFWISYADLMTALMVLFLTVMVISLLSVTQEIRRLTQEAAQRDTEINTLLSQVEETTFRFEGVRFNKDRLTIDFGERARFGVGDHRLTADTVVLMRRFVPELLAVARTDLGRKWLKQVRVEGFTDTTGSYLFNLDLSLKRAHSVLCSLVDSRPGIPDLPQEDAALVRALFLVGGFSSNAQRTSLEESRRVELRLDLLALNEARSADTARSADPNGVPLGRCQLP